ncbi:fimbrial protein [Halomonas sp. V046]|uniref:fimbrial protein n=1 Tax=Halomonas sp. V046 TaxID=3459611 RepID=UPI004043EF68
MMLKRWWRHIAMLVAGLGIGLAAIPLALAATITCDGSRLTVGQCRFSQLSVTATPISGFVDDGEVAGSMTIAYRYACHAGGTYYAIKDRYAVMGLDIRSSLHADQHTADSNQPNLVFHIPSVVSVGGVPGHANLGHTQAKADSCRSGNHSATFQLIKTGPLTAGNVNVAFSTPVHLASAKGTTYGTHHVAGALPTAATTIATPTCTLPSTNVALPNVPLSALTGVGDTAMPTPVTLDLSDCDRVKGIDYALTSAGTSVIDDNGIIGNALSGSDAAEGIGLLIQHYPDGATTPTPVTFAQHYLINTRQGDTSGTSGTLRLRFVASYYRYAAMVRAGNVEATLIATLSYR